MMVRDWTDGYFNPWWGCQKIAEGCRNCYAEIQSRIFKAGTGDLWSGKVRKMKEQNWEVPLLIHARNKIKDQHSLMACGSVCDWADPSASKFDRARMWGLIRDTKNIHWQLLTKRPIEAVKYLPYDWGLGWENVSIGVSVENQENVWKIGKLRSIPSKMKFVSFEPLLGDVIKNLDLTNIDWVLAGGEIGKSARPIDYSEVARIMIMCKVEKIPFYFKGWGDSPKMQYAVDETPVYWVDKVVGNLLQEEIENTQQFPKKYLQIGVR